MRLRLEEWTKLLFNSLVKKDISHADPEDRKS
jgi:hypothetical protein